VQEAKQAVELIGKWETIDVADALELLSPDFKSEEVSYLVAFVRAAVSVRCPREIILILLFVCL
jgi:phosphatidylinositol 3-kinase